MYVSPKKLKFLLNFYPPYIGAGVKLRHIREDWRYAQVSMKLRWFNRNAVGSHFGGSLYSMVDPQLMLMFMQILGRDYIVWDKSASIEFIQPAKSEVFADIHIDDAMIDAILHNTAAGEKYLPEFEIDIKDADKNLIAKVTKVLYFRKKPRHRK